MTKKFIWKLDFSAHGCTDPDLKGKSFEVMIEWPEGNPRATKGSFVVMDCESGSGFYSAMENMSKAGNSDLSEARAELNQVILTEENSTLRRQLLEAEAKIEALTNENRRLTEALASEAATKFIGDAREENARLRRAFDSSEQKVKRLEEDLQDARRDNAKVQRFADLGRTFVELTNVGNVFEARLWITSRNKFGQWEQLAGKYSSAIKSFAIWLADDWARKPILGKLIEYLRGAGVELEPGAPLFHVLFAYEALQPSLKVVSRPPTHGEADQLRQALVRIAEVFALDKGACIEHHDCLRTLTQAICTRARRLQTEGAPVFWRSPEMRVCVPANGVIALSLPEEIIGWEIDISRRTV